MYIEDNEIRIFLPDFALTNAILNCNRFKIEEGATSARVAKALEMYVFLINNFEAIADKIYSERSRSPFCDRSVVFCEGSGLTNVLKNIELVEGNKTDIEKVKALLEVYRGVLINRSSRTDAENKELNTVETLLNTENPIKDHHESCWDIMLGALLIVIAAIIGAWVNGGKSH